MYKNFIGWILLGLSIIILCSFLIRQPYHGKWIVTQYAYSGEVIQEWNDVKIFKCSSRTISFDTKDGKRIRISGNYRIIEQ